MNLTEKLRSCPVLYLITTEDQLEGFTRIPPKDYIYSVGVTLDYAPEEKKWIASYSDFYESEYCENPEEAVDSLMKKIQRIQ